MIWFCFTQPAGAADLALGAFLAEEERCVECHGVDGQGLRLAAGSDGRTPRLAGQSIAYMAKQIADFRKGARRHDQMQMMARTVAEEDFIEILAYFESRGPMTGDGEGSAQGRALYLAGDPARGIAPCASCHGPDGRGLPGNAAPRLNAQEWSYLDKQLRDWRSGERSNSEGGVMNQAARGLTDEEITALAYHLAAGR